MAEHHSPRQHDQAEHTRWNFVFIIAEASTFTVGLAWVDTATVLPLFVYRLSESTVLIGVITVLQRLGYTLPQLFVAALIGHRPRRRHILRWGVLLGRIPFLALVVYLWLFGVARPGTVIALVMLGYLATAVGNGVAEVPWHDIIAKSIPSRLRGRFFATMQFASSLGTIAVGFVVRWMLGPTGPGFPRDYTLLFTLVSVFFTLSVIYCWLVREPIRPVLDRPDSLRELLRSAVPLLRAHRAFRVLVVTALLGFSLAGATPFYMVFAKTELGVPEAMAGVYIWVMTLSSAVFCWVWGRLNDRYGPRSVLRGACTSVLLCPTFALALPTVVGLAARRLPLPDEALAYLFGLVFVSAGASFGGMWMGSTNYLLELATHQERPRYIALMSFLTAPGAFAALLVGLLLNVSPFRLVFALMVLWGGAAALAAWRMPVPRAHAIPGEQGSAPPPVSACRSLGEGE